MIVAKEFEFQIEKAINDELNIFDFLLTLDDINSVDDIDLVKNIVNKKFELYLQSSPIEWGKVQYLVLIASKIPSKRYVKNLCSILKKLSSDMTNEDVIELLQVIASEEAVFTLIQLLDVEMEGDHFHEINRKSLLALDAIGSKEAIDAIKLSTNSKYDEVRQFAKYLIDSLEESTGI
jgi:hypothetical protein